jgi:hypothetical protein
VIFIYLDKSGTFEGEGSQVQLIEGLIYRTKANFNEIGVL